MLSLPSPACHAALTPCTLVSAEPVALDSPCFMDLYQELQAPEKNAHGPFVMAAALVFLYGYGRWTWALGSVKRQQHPLMWSLIFTFGLLCCVLRRSQSVLILGGGSLILMLSGIAPVLTIAYARERRHDVKLHLSDICAPAQGYQILQIASAAQAAADEPPLIGKQMLASGNGGFEAVTYWARISNAYQESGPTRRMGILRDWLLSRANDSMPVRSLVIVSSNTKATDAYALREALLRPLIATIAPQRKILIARILQVRS